MVVIPYTVGIFAVDHIKVMSRFVCRHVTFVIGLIMGLLGSVVPPPTLAADILDQQEVVDKARFTLETFAGHPSMTLFQSQLKKAKAVFIAPSLIKGSFFFGGSLGNGVLLVKHEETELWSDPAFYTMAAGSFGLQIGAATSEVVLLVMTRRGFESMLETNVKLGAGARIAIGPVGGGIEGGTTPTLSVDLITYSRSRGMFGGLSLQGAVLASRRAWNHSYYGKPVELEDILINQSTRNHYSIGLLELITRATGGVWVKQRGAELLPTHHARDRRPSYCLNSPVPGKNP